MRELEKEPNNINEFGDRIRIWSLKNRKLNEVDRRFPLGWNITF